MSRHLIHFGLAITLLFSSLTLMGCGGMSANGVELPAPAAPWRVSLTGGVHGGQQPVSGASVYLFAAGATGYGQPAVSLLSGQGVSNDSNNNGYVITDGGGNFSITNDYNCPSSTSVVYLLATGGNPGLTAGTNNRSLTLAAAVGNCAALKANAASTFININELTTVAAAYALAGFMSSPMQLSASSTNLSGITSAFTTASMLVSTSLGAAPLTTPGGNGTIPQAELNTLADALSACVNSDGTVSGPASPTACYSLSNATTVNSIVPANTLQAILNIAQNPANNVATVAMLATAVAPFQPTLASMPNDWTVSITYSGGGINTPQGVAIDASGNAWISNTTNSITELSAGTGILLSGANGFTPTGLDAPVSLAIDTNGYVWIANCGDPCSASGNAGSVTELASNGQISNSYTSSGFHAPYAIALSGANQVWIANAAAGSLTQLNTSGGTLNASDTAAGLANPVSVAIDTDGNAFTVSPANNALAAFTSTGNAYTSAAYQGSALNFPYAVAIDHNGNAWVVNHGNNTVVELNAGSPVGSTPFTGGGITTPVAIALDGAGSAWVANTSNTLSEISTAGVVLSPNSGLRNDLVYPDSIAVDASGNVWVTNCGHYCEPASAIVGSVSELVGAATPVATPLSVGAAGDSLAARP